MSNKKKIILGLAILSVLIGVVAAYIIYETKQVHWQGGVSAIGKIGIYENYTEPSIVWGPLTSFQFANFTEEEQYFNKTFYIRNEGNVAVEIYWYSPHWSIYGDGAGGFIYYSLQGTSNNLRLYLSTPEDPLVNPSQADNPGALIPEGITLAKGEIKAFTLTFGVAQLTGSPEEISFDTFFEARSI